MSRGSRCICHRLVHDVARDPRRRRQVAAVLKRHTASRERRLGIRTACGSRRDVVKTRFGDSLVYETIDYFLIHHFMKGLEVGPDDVVFDIGCGMGRVLCSFALRPLRGCVGIESDPELAAIARGNALALRGRRAPVDVRCEDAADADYSRGTVFWMFNPFGAKTLAAVLHRIGDSLRERPRPVQIAYLNPVHESVLSSFPGLRLAGRHDSMVTYWSNHPVLARPQP
jgi:SAM-dependent methyltransferase